LKINSWSLCIEPPLQKKCRSKYLKVFDRTIMAVTNLEREASPVAEANELKAKLVRCIRMMDMIGLVEHNGHVSARIPESNQVLIQSRFSSRAALTTSDILTVDFQGNTLEGKDEPPSETSIHTCIYRVRDDVQAIAHIHSHYAILLGMSGTNFAPVCNDGVLFASGVPLFPHSWNIGTEERGEALAKTLGNSRAALMRGHGAVVVAEAIEGLFQAADQFEKNARLQCELLMMGRFQAFGEADIRYAPKQTLGGLGKGRTWKTWNYFVSLAKKRGAFD
jgi:ribulose-5-phosphate 4-epimerase/fuculose-1-phosphate aldolase